jgi:hypothetical protein
MTSVNARDGQDDHGAHGQSAPMSTLRGATVEVDVERVTRLIVAACLLALGVTVVLLCVAGIEKNARITELRDHGVAVVATVDSCRGELGGSGSNPVGYTCTGTYVLGGNRYDATLPGDRSFAPGAQVRGIAAASEPGVFTTAGALFGEHASWGVFLVPAVLFGLLLALAGAVVGRWRRRRRDARRAA